MSTLTVETLGSWVAPMPVVLARLEAAAAQAVANPTPENVDRFDALANIAEQRAHGGRFGYPIALEGTHR